MQTDLSLPQRLLPSLLISVVVFAVTLLVLIGHELSAQDRHPDPPISLAKLAQRVEALEKQLESDYDRNQPLSPELFAKLQADKEVNKDVLRRRQLLFNINGALFFNHKDGVSAVYESTLKPIDDPITQQVLEDYRKLGWKVTYMPNPAQPDTGLGYVMFELPQVQAERE